MSRCYAMEMVIRKEGLSEEEFEKIRHIYTNEWEDDTGFQNNEGAIFTAESTLCCGENDSEAHNRIRDAIKKVVPGCSVTTGWTYLEDLPYDEYTD